MLAPSPGALAALTELTGPPWEPAVLVDRDRQHVGIGVERGLRAVAVVDVPVDDRDPSDVVRGDRVHRGERDVGEDAETHRPIGLGVMAGRAHERVGVRHGAGRARHRSRRAPRRPTAGRCRTSPDRRTPTFRARPSPRRLRPTRRMPRCGTAATRHESPVGARSAPAGRGSPSRRADRGGAASTPGSRRARRAGARHRRNGGCRRPIRCRASSSARG